MYGSIFPRDMFAELDRLQRDVQAGGVLTVHRYRRSHACGRCPAARVPLCRKRWSAQYW